MVRCFVLSISLVLAGSGASFARTWDFHDNIGYYVFWFDGPEGISWNATDKADHEAHWNAEKADFDACAGRYADRCILGDLAGRTFEDVIGYPDFETAYAEQLHRAMSNGSVTEWRTDGFVIRGGEFWGGVWDCTFNHIDTPGDGVCNRALHFEFDTPVSLQSISLSGFYAEMAAYSSDLSVHHFVSNDIWGDRVFEFGDGIDLIERLIVSTWFPIAFMGDYDSSLVIDGLAAEPAPQVPLPPAGLLLAGALLAFGPFGRSRRAAGAG